MTRREKRRLFKLVAPIAVVVGAVVLAGVLIANKPEVPRTQDTVQGVLVEVERAELRPHRLDVDGQGTVQPAREITVQPQVSGRVQRVSPKLQPGGFLRKGDLLFEIEDADYRLAVAAQESALAQAEAQLELEQGRRSVAQREWELFRDELDADQREQSSLALREPQLKSARAAVETARAALERARLDLSRTVVRAPFNAFVRSESVDPGLTVSPSSRLVDLVGTDELWVQASIETGELPFIDVPGLTAGEGSAATVSYDAGSRTRQLDGRVVRLLGDLDPAGRMARVLIEVEDPFGLDEGMEGGELPLLVDSFVDVEIAGRRTEQLLEIPRSWLREGNRVWVFDADGSLDIRDVDIVWRRERTVLIGDGLTPADRIVTSSIVTPVDGMALRLERDRSAEPELDLAVEGVEESTS